MLFIGSVKGGPELQDACVGKLITKLMQTVAEVRGEFAIGSFAALNVVFHVPGSVIPDLGYGGLRDGRFFQTQRILMIQVAVPKELASSTDTEEVTRFLFDSLREANKIAAKYFKKKGIEYSQPRYLGLVDAVEVKFMQDA